MFEKKALATFSGGMKQRFGIAQALLGNPRLIIVDEPTAGLDPAERNRFLNLLSSLGSDRTVILSTHIVDDVRQLCPRMAIIASGELLLEGAPNDTLAALNGKIWSKVVATDARGASDRNSTPRDLHAPGWRTARDSCVRRALLRATVSTPSNPTWRTFISSICRSSPSASFRTDMRATERLAHRRNLTWHCFGSSSPSN